MSLAKRTLQRIVLAINRCPGGLLLTRLPYYLAVRVTARLLRKYPLISSAWIRNSYALGTWTPGLSDIDLTVILGSEHSLQSELDTVRSFWKSYAALQRWFPMLGEVEILNEAHFSAWSTFCSNGYEARHWICFHGNDLVRSGYQGGENQFQCDRLNHAISIYCHQMVPVLGSAQPATLLRYAKKILKYLDQPADKSQEKILAAMTREELQATVVLELGKKSTRHNAVAENGTTLDVSRVLGRVDDPVVQKGPDPHELARRSIPTSLESILHDAGGSDRVYYIPRDHIDIQSLVQCIAVANGAEGMAIVLTRDTFFHYLKNVDPLGHLALLQNRTLLWGSDPFESAGPWPEAVFHRAICSVSVDILALPYTRDLDQKTDEEFRGLFLGWVLRIARYFEDGIIEFDYDRLVAFWQLARPDSPVENRQSYLSGSGEHFSAIRPFADAVSEGMVSNTSGVQNLIT